jgi:hypothetical protein
MLLSKLENTHMFENSLEIHRKFYRTPKFMKLGPKFLIFLPHHGKWLSTPVYGMLLGLRASFPLWRC